jgi:hypothetical protein
LSLIAGAFTVVALEAYRRTKRAMEFIQNDGFVAFRGSKKMQKENKIK